MVRVIQPTLSLSRSGLHLPRVCRETRHKGVRGRVAPDASSGRLPNGTVTCHHGGINFISVGHRACTAVPVDTNDHMSVVSGGREASRCARGTAPTSPAPLPPRHDALPRVHGEARAMLRVAAHGRRRRGRRRRRRHPPRAPPGAAAGRFCNRRTCFLLDFGLSR